MCHNRILITGPPGCGKTTLIKNIVEKLRNEKIPCDGFFTEEVRVNGVRRGFDIVVLNNESRYPLAYISNTRGERKPPSVGRYTVDVDSFNSSLQQVFKDEDSSPKVLIIDEIGKMELFSENFKNIVKRLYDQKSNVIVASIPVERKNLPFVEQLCQSPSAELISVNVGNRNLLVAELTERISKLYLQICK
ncbi:hypothetical protein ACFE04_029092 [Oxalis oulophora]